MIRRDLPEVLAIERGSFEFPWSEEEFIRVLRQRGCIGRVAEDQKGIAGFMVYELSWRCLEVLNFAVAEDVRRRGVGRAMADDLKRRLSIQRRSRLVTHVREGNLPAQLFWRSQGLRAVMPIIRDRFDNGEDAYRFVYWVPGATVINRISSFLSPNP
jgi:ribosomal-protein-alanine N-acetyltransferase